MVILYVAFVLVNIETRIFDSETLETVDLGTSKKQIIFSSICPFLKEFSFLITS